MSRSIYYIMIVFFSIICSTASLAQVVKKNNAAKPHNVVTHAKDEGICKVSFTISGDRADGKGTYETNLDATEFCKDLSESQVAAKNLDWQKHYGSNYTLIGPASVKEDCAGHTFNKIFGKGEYVLNSTEFYNAFIFWFGKKIKGLLDPFTWGDVQAGDVLVYGKITSPSHITYVKDVSKTAGVITSVTIETKNGNEPTFEHKISATDLNDPTYQRFPGGINVYRLDPSRITVTKNSSPCNCNAGKVSFKLTETKADPSQHNDDKHISITNTNYTYTSDNSIEKYNLLNTPPAEIYVGQVFKLHITGSCQNQKIDYWVNAQWGNNPEGWSDIGDIAKGIENLRLGKMPLDGKIVETVDGDLTLKVPDFTGDKLYLRLQENCCSDEKMTTKWILYTFSR